VENIMSSKLFRTRQGTILLGVVAAVLAAIALIVYLNHYRSSVKGTAAATAVLVAKSNIPKNTSGDVIASSGLYKTENFAQNAVPAGAIVNPADLSGKVVVNAISADQPLTEADFASSGGGVAWQLSPKQRAVVVPLDSPATVDNQIAAGDSVDVYALITPANGSPVVKEILPNMYVLNTDSNGNVTLRASQKQAGQLIYASGNDKLWLTLRPARGLGTKSPTITANSLGG
jgi:Flp pilus assembly protein CpaB